MTTRTLPGPKGVNLYSTRVQLNERSWQTDGLVVCVPLCSQTGLRDLCNNTKWRLGSGHANHQDATEVPDNEPTWQSAPGGRFGYLPKFEETPDIWFSTVYTLTYPCTVFAWWHATDNTQTGRKHVIGSADPTDSPNVGNVYLNVNAEVFEAGAKNAVTYSFASHASTSFNTWWHLGGRFTNSNSRHALRNGVVSAEDTTGVGATEKNGMLGIGAQPDSTASNFFDGFITDVRFYDRALSDEEIQDIYHYWYDLYKPSPSYFVPPQAVNPIRRRSKSSVQLLHGDLIQELEL